ncbi:MAG: di-heme-cytochrome C peroxidase [Methylococcales bacterium]
MKKYRMPLMFGLTILMLGAYQNISAIEAAKGYSAGAPNSAKLPDYVDQGWNHETRMEWWYTSQGTWIIPYEWFLALERTEGEELFSSQENLEQRLRYIGWPADPKWNPDGLPIGFVKDKDRDGTSYFGVTCAACHTGKVEYTGKSFLTEGGPAHGDFDRLVTEIGESLQATLDDDKKFERFASRVLGDKAEPAGVAKLKKKVEKTLAPLVERIKVNHPPYPNGYSRLDAFGNIFNEGSVFSINQPVNAKPADAPVSIPVVWDAAQHDILQWNGSAVNAGIGPYTRNTGEVVGVFGDLRVGETRVAGTKKLRYEHHIRIRALERLEVILMTLCSPAWPEATLPAIDRKKAALGKQHYEANCVSCHQPINRSDPKRHIAARMIPVTEVGTDPTMATNVAKSIGKTGIMEGQPMIPITKWMPGLGVIDPFGPEAPTAKVVGNGILGALRDELGLVKFMALLPDYIKAAKKNALYDDCDPKEQGQKCFRPPRYKARPLNGIWSSAPFLHNGSVPNLSELLKKPGERVARFHVGRWDFDPVNVGFSTEGGPNTSEFDTSEPNNSNLGHDYGTNLSDNEKSELIEYVKTL